jgi:hypothetical protein
VIEQVALDRLLGGLRSHLKTIKQHRNYTDKFLGDGFNVLDFIGYDENSLSDLIAKFLDPAGGHGQDTAFLLSFLGLAAGKPTREETENVFVQLEQAVRRNEAVIVKREHGTSGRRFIDIVVDVGQFRFAIENKPRAADQDKQVSDYIKHLKHSSHRGWAFIYLNGYGARPSDSSLCGNLRQELLGSGHYVELDYATDLAEWAQQCARVCDAEKIRWLLRDFHNYILREFKSELIEGNDDVR